MSVLEETCRWISAVILWAMLGIMPSVNAADKDIVVYKSPTCGCCKLWEQHLQRAGFSVKSVNVQDVVTYKIRHGVTPELGSCHTALVEGYVIEGHVPASDIRRLLRERPKVKGLAVPGMPMGSPGMEGPTREAYNVLSFDAAGNTKVYAQH
jgi:hypothetical protein